MRKNASGSRDIRQFAAAHNDMRDRSEKTSKVVCHAGWNNTACFSSDGRRAAFHSYASFVHGNVNFAVLE